MKAITTKNTIAFLLMTFVALAGCSGGDGGNNSPPASSNWDQMVWDQDNWS